MVTSAESAGVLWFESDVVIALASEIRDRNGMAGDVVVDVPEGVPEQALTARPLELQTEQSK